MKPPKAGGGWTSIFYAFDAARRAGGLLRFFSALRARNACKTCALGMGGQLGGMANEAGHFPEVCKKSMQAMAADMQGRIERRFFENYSIEQMRRMTPRELEHMGRLAEPMLARADDSHYRPISWDEALAVCVERLTATLPDENFFYFSGRSSNEAGFIAQLFARLYGTNNVNNCSYYCHQASAVGLAGALGGGTGTVQLDDLGKCDLVLLVGGNPASNHPRLMTSLMQLRRRGGQIVVVNPIVETGLVRFKVPSDWRSLLFGTEIATHYVQPHAGGDLALLVGLAKRVDELGAVDEGFVAAHTNGAAELRAALRDTGWEQIEAASGVDREMIDRVARVYAASRATIFAWTMGITHHAHGTDNVRAIANLALLRGMIGRPGAGVMPIRGHSNVQGVGSMGVTPKLKDAVFSRLERHFGVTLPTTPGMDTLACMQAMAERRVKNGWCVGGNLFGSNPDAAATTRAFSNLESAVYFTTTLNTGHAWGRARQTLILPVKARDEEDQATTQESMFSFVRLSEGGPERFEGPRSEVQIFATLARRVLGESGPIDWRSLEKHRNIRRAIAAVIPEYEPIGRIDETGAEFHVAGRAVREPRFKTPDGRARLHVTPIPSSVLPPGQLRLMTIRSEGQFNTVVYEDYDLYRGQDRRDVILLNSDDMQRLGLEPGRAVAVESEVGRMVVVARAFAIRAGNAAMYYPEANILVPRVADSASKTPAFKNIPITVTPTSDLPVVQVAESRRRKRSHQRLSAC
ncbi:Formate dehydrogenase H [Phycisphaerae bacterium RAS1]|nr:Formate dehydrogenase H [Phycisphaerae bacterium RAS1]